MGCVDRLDWSAPKCHLGYMQRRWPCAACFWNVVSQWITRTSLVCSPGLRALDLFGLILYSLTDFVATRFIFFAIGDLLPFFDFLGVAVQASYFGDFPGFLWISAAKELNQTALFYAARQVRVFFSRFFVKGPVSKTSPSHSCLVPRDIPAPWSTSCARVQIQTSWTRMEKLRY